jgi:hypothetical protein
MRNDPPSFLARLQRHHIFRVTSVYAIAAARRAADILPLGKEAYFGVFKFEGLAEIETHAGASNEAIELIGKLLAIPVGECMSIAAEAVPSGDGVRGFLAGASL